MERSHIIYLGGAIVAGTKSEFGIYIQLEHAGTAQLVSNIFTGTISGNTISGTTTNGGQVNNGCSASSGPSGVFNVSRQGLP